MYLAKIQDRMLIAVNSQLEFLKAIPNANEVLNHGLLLTQTAKILDIPILAIIQYQKIGKFIT